MAESGQKSQLVWVQSGCQLPPPGSPAAHGQDLWTWAAATCSGFTSLLTACASSMCLCSCPRFWRFLLAPSSSLTPGLLCWSPRILPGPSLPHLLHLFPPAAWRDLVLSSPGSHWTRSPLPAWLLAWPLSAGGCHVLLAPLSGAQAHLCQPLLGPLHIKTTLGAQILSWNCPRSCPGRPVLFTLSPSFLISQWALWLKNYSQSNPCYMT